MKSYYNTIYLSPHLDDIALSCGGQIFAQSTNGKSILIVSIMAGDPPKAPLSDFAISLHERWDTATDAVLARRAEDVAACHVLGAGYLHWMIPDCVYRQHSKTGKLVYPTWNDVISGIHPAESSLISQLAKQIANLPEHDRLVVPLTVGNHVDHKIVRLAAERSLEDNSLFYYEDFPYAGLAGTLDAVLQTESRDLCADVFPLQKADLAARVEAIAAYGSQISTFFNGRSDIEKQLTDYTQTVGGERLWYYRSTT